MTVFFPSQVVHTNTQPTTRPYNRNGFCPYESYGTNVPLNLPRFLERSVAAQNVGILFFSFDTHILHCLNLRKKSNPILRDTSSSSIPWVYPPSIPLGW